MNIPEYLKKIRTETALVLSAADDATRSEAVDLHSWWAPDAHYSVGDVVRRGEQLYRCLIEHDAQPAWTPEDSPSLWTKIMYKEGIRIIPDVIEAAQAFALNELGWWHDAVYRSLLNGNVYTPEQYPAGWEEVTRND